MVVKTVRKGLNRETRALLEYIRRMAPVNTACGLSEQVAINKAHMAVDRVITASGIDHSMVEELRWMVEDVARALTCGQDEVLAFALDGVLVKWLKFDLEPNTVQLLLRIVLREVAGIEVPTLGTSESRVQKPESRVEEAGEGEDKGHKFETRSTNDD